MINCKLIQPNVLFPLDFLLPPDEENPLREVESTRPPLYHDQCMNVAFFTQPDGFPVRFRVPRGNLCVPPERLTAPPLLQLRLVLSRFLDTSQTVINVSFTGLCTPTPPGAFSPSLPTEHFNF